MQQFTSRGVDERAGFRAGSSETIREWASNDKGGEPDVVIDCCGDVPTLQTLAAVDLLRKHVLELKVRIINIVNLMKLQPSDRDFEHGEDHPFVLGWKWGEKPPLVVRGSSTERDNV
jgi:phosphoketolase